MNKITENRMRKGMSKKELANKSSLSVRTLEKIENGEILNPGIITLKKVAGALEVNLETLAVDYSREVDRHGNRQI